MGLELRWMPRSTCCHHRAEQAAAGSCRLTNDRIDGQERATPDGMHEGVCLSGFLLLFLQEKGSLANGVAKRFAMRSSTEANSTLMFQTDSAQDLASPMPPLRPASLAPRPSSPPSPQTLLHSAACWCPPWASPLACAARAPPTLSLPWSLAPALPRRGGRVRHPHCWQSWAMARA
jgi:hypothetical protein